MNTRENHPKNCGCHGCHHHNTENRDNSHDSDTGGSDPSDDHEPLSSLHHHRDETDLKELEPYTRDIMEEAGEISLDKRRAFGHYHMEDSYHHKENHKENCQCDECVSHEETCDYCGHPLSLCHCDFLGDTYHLYLFHMINLTCPICAARMEKRIRRLPAVFFASVSFKEKLLQVISEESLEVILPVLKKIVSEEDKDVSLKISSGPEAEKTKEYLMPSLDCPNCTMKLERLFNDQPGVISAEISYATKKLRLTAENPDALIPELIKAANKVEPGTQILFPSEVKDKEGRDEQESFFDRRSILWGSVAIYAAGLVSYYLVPSFHTVSIVLLILSYIFLGAPVFIKLYRNLSHGEIFDENVLMAIATGGALALGEYPEAAGVLLFYRIGEFFEDRASEQSRKEITAALDMRPDKVIRVDGTEKSEVPAEEIRVGDVILIRPGDQIPLDGLVVEGVSTIDTSPLTGESVPQAVEPGSMVISGSINQGGMLKVHVDKELSESMVTRILKSVENAASSKPKMERFITRFSRIYTPAVVLIALFTAVIPPVFFHASWSHWIYTALTFLVISCPCALVISVPLAFFAGIGFASRKGILFKNGHVMEVLNKVKAVVMDKTGTLTTGVFHVSSVKSANGMSADELLSIAGGLESFSTHPIARSIVDECGKRGIDPAEISELEEVPGKGIRGKIGNLLVSIGNRKMAQDMSCDIPVEDNKPGIILYIVTDRKLAGVIHMADTIKPDAKKAIESIRTMGITTVMLTGDQMRNAENIAENLGIDKVYASLLPEDKLTKMKEVRKEAGSVFYIGDGINDAPVLAGADAGAAMGSGSDAAMEVADVVFLRSNASAIPEAISIAGDVLKTARNSAIFAIIVKTVIMILGLLGYANMWIAVFADTGVTLLCILYAIRILKR